MQPTLIPHAIAALLGVGAARADERFRLMSRALLVMLGARSVAEVSQLFRPNVADRIAAHAAGLPVAPYEGIARASWAVEQVAVVAWYALLARAAWRALKDEAPGERLNGVAPSGAHLLDHPDSNRSPEPEQVRAGVTLSRTTASHCRDVGRARSIYLALTFLASSALLFFLYPIVRGRPTEVASVVVFCAALAVQLVAATRYIHRWRRPDAAQGVALVLVVGSVADAAGPFIQGRPSLHWLSGEPVGVLIWCVVGGVALCRIVTTREH